MAEMTSYVSGGTLNLINGVEKSGRGMQPHCSRMDGIN